MGGELYTRNRSGCQLTPLGRLVEPGLRNILKVSQTTKADAIRFTNLNNTPLRIGLMASIGAHRLSPFFARYQRNFPNVELELIIDDETELLEQLQSEALDLVICSPSQLIGEPYQATLLYEERYVVAFSPDHRFNQMAKVKLYAAYRSNSEEWGLHMVRVGIGVALIPEYTLPPNDGSMKHRYLGAPVISRKIYAIHAPQFTKKSEFKDFILNLNGCLSIS